MTQAGDDEGCLHLDRLPTPTEADVIREALGIRRRKHLRDDTLAVLRDRFQLQKNALSRPPIDLAA